MNFNMTEFLYHFRWLYSMVCIHRKDRLHGTGRGFSLLVYFPIFFLDMIFPHQRYVRNSNNLIRAIRIMKTLRSWKVFTKRYIHIKSLWKHQCLEIIGNLNNHLRKCIEITHKPIRLNQILHIFVYIFLKIINNNTSKSILDIVHRRKQHMICENPSSQSLFFGTIECRISYPKSRIFTFIHLLNLFWIIWHSLFSLREEWSSHLFILQSGSGVVWVLNCFCFHSIFSMSLICSFILSYLWLWNYTSLDIHTHKIWPHNYRKRTYFYKKEKTIFSTLN